MALSIQCWRVGRQVDVEEDGVVADGNRVGKHSGEI